MKIVASDFDNTLYFREGVHAKKAGFRDKDLINIKRFQEAGGKFGICTGRPLKGVLMPTGDKIKYDFYITCSGGQVFDSDLNPIFEKTIPYNKVKEVINHYPDISISFVTDEDMYVYSISEDTPKDIGILIDTPDIDVEELVDFSLHFEEGDLLSAKECTEFINNNYSKYMQAFQNNNHVDVTGEGCSKGEGLHIIEEYYHSKDSIGIGDNFNDMSLLEEASTSYCFTYSPELVKQCSDFIVGELNECIDDLLK